MQRKPGQISSTTLGLRFMQNAARAKQEKEVEAVKAKVKSQEEWEISSSNGNGWNKATEEQGTVTYEPSYLPFLFPGLSGAHAPAMASTSTGNSDDLGSSKDTMRGRRKFGKHGKEDIQEAPPSEASPPLPPLEGSFSLSRGARTISSRGRAAAQPSMSSRPPKMKPTPRSAEQTIQQPVATTSAKRPPVFMKPQVDAPRADSGERNKRSVADIGSTEDGQRKKKKKRKETES